MRVQGLVVTLEIREVSKVFSELRKLELRARVCDTITAMVTIDYKTVPKTFQSVLTGPTWVGSKYQ